MKKHLYPALKLTLLCAVFFAALYPFLLWGIAQLAVNQGRGKILDHAGRTMYVNIGQSFSSDTYFYSRPSAVNYNAAGAGGSNKSATNPEYLKEVSDRIDSFLLHNPGITKAEIPAELVTASGSGLDPHISAAAARVQIKRIAAARNIPEKTLEKLVDSRIREPFLGFVGPPVINVLQLNIALDKLKN